MVTRMPASTDIGPTEPALLPDATSVSCVMDRAFVRIAGFRFGFKLTASARTCCACSAEALASAALFDAVAALPADCVADTAASDAFVLAVLADTAASDAFVVASAAFVVAVAALVAALEADEAASDAFVEAVVALEAAADADEADSVALVSAALALPAEALAEDAASDAFVAAVVALSAAADCNACADES